MQKKWQYRIVQGARVIEEHGNLLYMTQRAIQESGHTRTLIVVEASTDWKSYEPIAAFRGDMPASISVPEGES